MWDSAADDLEFGMDDPYEMPPEVADLEVPVADFDADDFAGLELEESGDCLDEEPEFATFDSENESHRKRLQRGTPVVLDPELFTDPDVTRRGVFVSRSPGGDYARVVRDSDGKEIKVHLSDIKSADLVNNSVYEEYNINFDALLAEDITMTQTTNMEQPENDTTTVTAVGAEAGEELAAMMANAGLNGGMQQDAEVVDLGEPQAEPEAPIEMPMQDMIGMMGEPEPETMEGRDDELPPMYTPDEIGDVEPSNADLDQIEFDGEFELDFDMEEATDLSGNQVHTPMTRDQAMAADGPVGELENILTKFNDSDILAWLEDGHEGIDEALYAISMEDMPYGTQKGRTGDPTEWLYNRYGEEIEAYAEDNFGSHLGEERDIEHANTPDERTAGVDMVTHGTSGGLNRPKTMHKPAAGGDNAMQRPMKEDDLDEISPDMPAVRDRTRSILNDPDEEEGAEPKLKRRAQRSNRYLRSKHGMHKATDGKASDIYAMYDDEMTEELSPENQKKNDALLAQMKAERDWSTSSKGSRLTGHGRGTGRHDKSVRFGLGEGEEKKEWKKPWEEDEDETPTGEDDFDKDQKSGYPGDNDDKDVKEEVTETFVNEHESVDNFLDMYKEFRIRTEKK